ncbi:MAG: nitroreductase family protein [Bacteroidota bacterium]
MNLDLILSRRSIRRYKPEPVPEEAIEAMLRAAMSAPSAGNGQPWRFVVLDDRRLLDEIPRFHPHAQMLKEAPAAILVCAAAGEARYAGKYWVQDCAAATENILLAAHVLGLGAVWLGVYPEEARMEGLRKLLAIPGEIVPFALVAVGHPAERQPPAERYDPGRVHRNRW